MFDVVTTKKFKIKIIKARNQLYLFRSSFVVVVVVVVFVVIWNKKEPIKFKGVS